MVNQSWDQCGHIKEPKILNFKEDMKNFGWELGTCLWDLHKASV